MPVGGLFKLTKKCAKEMALIKRLKISLYMCVISLKKCKYFLTKKNVSNAVDLFLDCQ